VAYRIALIQMTLTDLQYHSPIALFKRTVVQQFTKFQDSVCDLPVLSFAAVEKIETGTEHRSVL